LRASIIIPAYNARKTLGECLTACLAQDRPDFEIIVVDDGSTDDTSLIAQQFEAVRYHRQPNGGPASARNAGARLATGEILIYTDADCIPHADWLRQLTDGFEEGVVAVGGTYAIANPASRLARVIQAEIAQRHRQFKGDVDFLGSFNVAYRRDAFEAVGGFDESYRQASGEDNDLAYRLHDQGGRMVFNPTAVVAHYHPERLLAYLRIQSRHGYWRVKLYRDHPRRAGGDQYAGWPDLVAPPLGLALPFFLILIAVAGAIGRFGILAPILGLALVLFYTALHAPLALRLRHELCAGDLLYFLLVACLRDSARAVGLVHGLWTFTFRNRNKV
jgi:glycosyltransferase involved in cell wall biosynthesis